MVFAAPLHTGGLQRAAGDAFPRTGVPSAGQGRGSRIPIPDGPVLVVGAGNSGAQIALELARYRKVWLAGRSPGHLPRRLLGRDLFDWVWPLMSRASADTRFGRRLRERTRHGGDQRIGIDERALADAGIVVPGLRGGAAPEASRTMPVHASEEPIALALVGGCIGAR